MIEIGFLSTLFTGFVIWLKNMSATGTPSQEGPLDGDASSVDVGISAPTSIFDPAELIGRFSTAFLVVTSIMAKSSKITVKDSQSVQDVFSEVLTAFSRLALENASLKGQIEAFKQMALHPVGPATASYANIVSGVKDTITPDRQPTTQQSTVRSQRLPPTGDDFSLLIYPKVQGHNASEILRRHLDPAELNLGSITLHPLRNGGAVANVEDSQKVQKFKEIIEDHAALKELVDTKLPFRFKPQVKIYGIDPDVTRNLLAAKLRSQNGLEFADEDFIVRSGFLENANTGIWVASVDVSPSLHKVLLEKEKLLLGWTRCTVEDYVHVIRCTNCCKYGHTRHFCQQTSSICKVCAESHPPNVRCESMSKKCNACLHSNLAFNTGYSVDHAFNDKNCPVFLREVRRRLLRTET